MSEDAKKYRAEMRTKAYRIANQSDEPVDASDWRRTADDLTAKKKVTIKQGPFEKCDSGPSNPREYANGGLVARKNGGRMPRKGRAMGGQNMPVAPMPSGAALGNQIVPQAILNPRGVTQGSKLVGMSSGGGALGRADGGGMGNSGRKRMYPAYSTTELEASLASGKHAPGSDTHTKMSGEIAARKSGASQPFVVPQIQGGRAQTKVGRMSSGGGINIKPSHKGMLHKELGVPEGKKIPEKKLEKAADSSNPAERKRAVFAENAKKWNHRADGGRAQDPDVSGTRPTGGRIAKAGGGSWNPLKWGKSGKSSADKAEDSLRKIRSVAPDNSYTSVEVNGKKASSPRVAHASGGRSGKGKTNINIIIAQKPDGMMGQGMPPGAPPPPRPGMAPPPGTMPGAPGMGGPGGPMPPQGAPPMPGGMPARPMPGGPNMPPPSMMRKAGGRIPGYPLDAGAGGGKGRLEKAKAYGL